MKYQDWKGQGRDLGSPHSGDFTSSSGASARGYRAFSGHARQME
jgi:hypothetical protein